MGNSVPRVIGDVVYLPTDNPSEHAAYLLARTIPVGVSAFAFERAPLDVQEAVQSMLQRLHTIEMRDVADGALRGVVDSAVAKAMPSEMISTLDAVSNEVIDALRTSGFRVVRA